MLNPELNLFEKIKIAHKANFHGIEPWMNEFEKISKKDLVKCCEDYGIEIKTSIAIKGYFENDGELMDVADDHEIIFEECKRRMELSVEIGAKWIIVCPAFSNRNHETTWEQSIDYYKKLYDLGKKIGCEPTLEFIGATKQIYNFKLCKKFLDHISHETTMVIDAYHLWRGGGGMDDFCDFAPERISCLHISDADKLISCELHRDRDRVMPLDGKIDLKVFAETAKKIGYKSFVNAGVYNPKLWEMDQLDMAKLCMERMVMIFEE